jgi:hypothetical protein
VPAPVPASVTVNPKVVAVLNVAVTLSAALIVTTQLPVPVQAPLQPAKVLPLFGVSVSVTCDPLAKFDMHVLGHNIPAGLLDTVPLPVPALVTVSGKVAPEANVAVTDSAAVMFATQLAVPEQPAPLHPVNVLPLLTVAVRNTCDPVVKLALHPVVEPVVQLMPAGLLVTFPDPVPFTVIVRRDVGLNVAVIVAAAFIVSVQGAIPAHPKLLKPANTEAPVAVAVSVTCVPAGKLAEHVDGQLIPAGLLITVPVPVPIGSTVKA